MSATKELAPPRTRRPAVRPTRRAVAVGAAAAAVVAAGTVAALVLLGGSDTPRGGPADPITLPATVDGLSPQPAEQDRTRTEAWQKDARAASPDRTIVGRTYGTTSGARSIQVVAARTDLKGKLSLGWAGDAGTEVGGARCTRTVSFTPATPARERPTVTLCWRTSDAFSVYAFTIDPKASTPVPFSAGAAAVDAVWRAASDG